MILVGTGPLVALFDPKDSQHGRCVATLKEFREPIRTTVPVLTEAFHMLAPDSIGSPPGVCAEGWLIGMVVRSVNAHTCV
jgi:hypothetical protein